MSDTPGEIQTIDLADTTAPVLAEEARLFNRLPIVLYEAVPSRTDSDLWVLAYINQAIEAVTGYPPEDFIGEHPRRFLYEMVHPDDRVRVGAEYDRSRTTESMVSLRYRLRHRDQGYRMVEERSVFERDRTGRQHCFATLLDAGEPRRQARRNALLDGGLERLHADVAVATGQEFLDHLCRRLAHLTGVRQVAFFRVEQGQYLECLVLVRDGLLMPRFGMTVENSLLKPLVHQSRVNIELTDRDREWWPPMEGIRHAEMIRLDNRRHQWVGALSLNHDRPIVKSPMLERVLELYSDRSVTEIERLGLERQLQESEARYRAFFDTGVQASLVVNLSGRVVNFNRAACRLFDLSGDVDEMPLALADILPRTQPDGRLSLYHLMREVRQSLDRTPTPSRWAVRTRRGEARTVILHLSSTVMNLTEQVMLTFEDITDQLAAERALYTQHQLLNERQERLRGLVRLATELETRFDIQDLLDVARQELSQQSGVVSVLAYQAESGLWLPPLSGGAERDHHLPRVRRVLESGSILYEQREGSWLYLPLLDHEVPVAVLILACSEPVFQDREFVSLLAQTLNLSFDNLLQRRNLRCQAMSDSLTRLGNRAQLHEWVRLSLEKDPQQQASLLLFDLNRFKEINDSLGHHLGDRLLCEIGPRIVSTFDWVGSRGLARLGGDEFAVFLPNVAPAEAMDFAGRLSDALSKPYVIDQLQLQVEASIGVAHHPDHGEDSHELLRRADVAMYSAKNSGQAVVAFSALLDASTPQRIAVLSELDKGLQEGQLWVAFQPVIHATEGHTVGFEALVRWEHPELGPLSPAEFIPIAEMGQGIRLITEFVLRTGLAQLVAWRRRSANLYVAVNLSSRVLLDQSLPRQVSELLRRYRLPGSALVLELTESTLLTDPRRAIDIINQLAALGVQVAVDDFGTGYSSLSYLKSLPIHALKIDKSFVDDLLVDDQDRVIVESTIQMAHNLGLSTIAEGVEDEATLIELVKMGCDAIQGYFFSRPLSARDMNVWLDRHR